MTDTTTRERVARAIAQNLHGAAWQSYLPTADAALAAMQPPTETRWVIDRSKGLAAYRSAVREALKAGADIHAQQQAGYRSEFLVNLRDFADGVSDEVLRNAFEAVGAANVSPEHMRCVIRALADQEEGK